MVLIPKSAKKEIHRIMPACYIFQSQFHAEKEFTPSSSRMSPLQKILENYRANSKTEREKGTYFEKLTQAYFEKDDIQRQEFSRVWTYAEWAKSQGISKSDTGIDLVAEMADGSGVCAIQCKFYAADYAVQKSDIDSFFTASGKKPFARRIIIDSTEVEYSKNALDALHGQQIPTSRIGLHQISESRIDWDKFLSSEKVSFRAKKIPHASTSKKLSLRCGKASATQIAANSSWPAARVRLTPRCTSPSSFFKRKSPAASSFSSSHHWHSCSRPSPSGKTIPPLISPPLPPAQTLR
ncbi:MAG: hypothetical protein HC767_13860 [Akkermansiaceae bacterium]|nr:hypothetical protein [Akkermansiaceae bacterium]